MADIQDEIAKAIGRRVGPRARPSAPAHWSWPVARYRRAGGRGSRARRPCWRTGGHARPRRRSRRLRPNKRDAVDLRGRLRPQRDHAVGRPRSSPGRRRSTSTTSRRRGRDEAVRLQLRLRRRVADSRATASARCWWSTTSTPTRTSCSRPAVHADHELKAIAMVDHGMSVVDDRAWPGPRLLVPGEEPQRDDVQPPDHMPHRVRGRRPGRAATPGCRPPPTRPARRCSAR